jgi:hypothetical protein
LGPAVDEAVAGEQERQLVAAVGAVSAHLVAFSVRAGKSEPILADCLMGRLTVWRGQIAVGDLDPDKGLAVVVSVIQLSEGGFDVHWSFNRVAGLHRGLGALEVDPVCTGAARMSRCRNRRAERVAT